MKKVQKRRDIQRKSRIRNNFKTFALVGYTNAGKTLLFNKLTKSHQASKDILFQTLDTKISKIFLKKGINVGIIDTVGFINNIPTQLIESFKATLEEVHSADYLINVVDINDQNSKDKIKTTKKILRETGIEENKLSMMITVFNKIDIKQIDSLNLKGKSYVSALTGEGVNELRSSLTDYL